MKTITYDEWDFEISFEDLEKALYKIFSDFYKISIESAEEIINDLDLWDQLEEFFEDEIKEYFEDEALEKWRQYEEDKKEGHPWDESWFH